MLEKNRETFQAIDFDKSGLISVDELTVAMSENDKEPTAEEKSFLEHIVKKVDYDMNGEINYSEFLTGTLNEVHFSQDNLYHLFK